MFFLRSYSKNPNTKVFYVNANERDHVTKDYSGKSWKIHILEKICFQKSGQRKLTRHWEGGGFGGNNTHTYKFIFIENYVTHSLRDRVIVVGWVGMGFGMGGRFLTLR